MPRRFLTKRDGRHRSLPGKIAIEIRVQLRLGVTRKAFFGGLYRTQEASTYGVLGNFQVDHAPGVGYCLALRAGCCFGGDSPGYDTYPEVPQLPASVYPTLP